MPQRRSESPARITAPQSASLIQNRRRASDMARFVERKGKREERAYFRGNEFDLATMRDEQRANDGKAHAGAAAVPARGEKTVEDASAIVRRNAGAVVPHEDARHWPPDFGVDVEAGRAMPLRIVGEMREHDAHVLARNARDDIGVDVRANVEFGKVRREIGYRRREAAHVIARSLLRAR